MRQPWGRRNAFTVPLPNQMFSATAKVLQINGLHFSADYDVVSTVAAQRRSLELNPVASAELTCHQSHVYLRKELDGSRKIEAP